MWTLDCESGSETFSDDYRCLDALGLLCVVDWG